MSGWRYGRTIVNSAGKRLHNLAVKLIEPKPRSPRYLSESERIVIADLLARCARSPAHWAAVRRRLAARSVPTETRTDAIDRTMPSTLPERGCGARDCAGSRSIRCWL